MSPVQPSDIYPGLTWERLMALRKIFWDTRAWVAADAKPDRGDDRTVVGYRAWAHAKFEVTKKALKEFVAWLSIKHGGPYFTFKVAMMPVRFCRGDSEEGIPPKYRYPQEGEEADINEAAKESGLQIDGIFRIINEADANGAPLRVWLVYADRQGETIHSWEIPEALDESGGSPIVQPTKPVTLGPLDEKVKTKADLAAEKEAAELKQNEEGA